MKWVRVIWLSPETAQTAQREMLSKICRYSGLFSSTCKRMFMEQDLLQ